VINNDSAASIRNQANENLTRNSQETDSDNDGMPDWWENHWALYAENNNLSNKFDPYNASDANEDWDEDLLSNLIEYQRMTNPYVPDLEIENGTPLENDKKNTDDLDDRDYTIFLMLGLIITGLMIMLAIAVWLKKK
jgi:hypothetical protein